MKLTAVDPQQINERLYPIREVHVPLESPDAFAESHVKLFREQGFLAVENVLSPKEIAESLQALSDVIADRDTQAHVEFVKPQSELNSPEERELAVRKVASFIETEPRLDAMFRHPAIQSIIERLFGERPKHAQDMALLKPPHGGGEKPWHQDMAYGPLAFDKSVIGVWIALDEAGLDNGCMHVIPRSHMDGPTPHYAVRDWQICDANVPVGRDVAVPLKPGGVLFFHGLLYHGTPFNFSDKRRRALQFHYAPESATKLRPKEYKRIFTNELTNAEC